MDRLRPPRAGLHSRVVGDHDGRASFDAADTGDHAGAGRLSVVFVIRYQQSDFEEVAAGIGETGDALARRQLARFVLLLDARGTAALAQFVFESVQAVDEVAHPGRRRIGIGVHWNSV